MPREVGLDHLAAFARTVIRSIDERNGSLKYNGRVLLWRTSSKTTMETELFSQSWAHQLLKWQEDILIQFQDFSVWQEKPTTQYQHQRKRI